MPYVLHQAHKQLHASRSVPLRNSASHRKTSDIFDNLPDSLVANPPEKLSQEVNNASMSELDDSTVVYIFLATH